MIVNQVSVFDNLQTFLSQIVELLSQILNAVRVIPNFIAESGSQILRYKEIFPSFFWFLVSFAFGSGIIVKLLKWGGS